VSADTQAPSPAASGIGNYVTAFVYNKILNSVVLIVGVPHIQEENISVHNNEPHRRMKFPSGEIARYGTGDLRVTSVRPLYQGADALIANVLIL
jgi:hypothetical protein